MSYLVRSLFWKIFLTIMIVNIAFVVANAYWVGILLEKRFMRDQFFEGLENQLLQMVDEHEQRLALDQHHSHPPRHFRQPKAVPRHVLRHFQLEIFDTTTDQPLWRAPPRRHIASDAQRKTLEITSSSGTIYRARYLIEPKLQVSLWKILSRFGFAKWIITFVLAALGSSVLSLLIVAPLRALIAHTHRLAEGDLATRLHPKLAHRADEIGQLALAFNEMSDQIQTLIERQQSLLHDVSHELRAPLQRLQVAVELSRDQWLANKSDVRLFDRQQREIEKIQSMIDEILVLARLNSLQEGASYTRHQDKSPVVVVDKIKNTVAALHLQYPTKKIHFVLDGFEATSIDVDLFLFERVLNNIIENAFKHTPPEASIEIEIQKKSNGEALNQALGIEIIIHDNGQGVEADLIQHLTEPFYRVPITKPSINSIQKEKTEGFGLGLSITAKAVEQMGGKLRIDRSKHGGLAVAVWFKLPPELQAETTVNNHQ